MKLEYIVTNNDNNRIIKDILSSHFKISHRLLITLKKNNCIFLNNSPSFVYQKLKEGDKLVLSFDYEEDNSNIIPNEMPLDIVYEDDWYLIINKPSGIAVHPSILHYEDSLSNGIRFYFDSIRSKEKN